MSQPPIIACVKWGKAFGNCYVNILYDMVRRNLPSDTSFTFMCFTDDVSDLHPDIIARPLPGGLSGWWNKLYLFKEGVFAPDDRVIYFDLDTLITGDISDILQYQGEFALLRDFYRPEGYGSGVMLWRGAAVYPLWAAYEAAGKPMVTGGDQAWIERHYTQADRLQDIFPQAFVSFKADCKPLPPKGARVVCFHGTPKQDDCDMPWVRELWKIGGAEKLPAWTSDEEKLAYIRSSMLLRHAWLHRTHPNDKQAVLIAGGPTLNECAAELRAHREQGHTLIAVHQAAAWLDQQNIAYDAHVMASVAKENTAWVPAHHHITHYYASSCHPDILGAARGERVLWHPTVMGIAALLKKDARHKTLLKGSTAGLNAIELAHALGYRHMHLYGFDSCYDTEGRHHAYAQPASDQDRRFDMVIDGHMFTLNRWMQKQVAEFFALAEPMMKEGCDVRIYGDGLIAHMAQKTILPVEASA